MTLRDLLARTGHHSQPIGDRGAIQVFGNGWRYYRLSDYVVTSAVSGPSLVLVPCEPVLDRRRGLDGDTLLSVEPGGGPNCCPPRPFFVRLPSGLRHWYESEDAARASQYWPAVAS